ncbi:MAG: hypothetical protein HN509_11390 [Halobacteriovoraceae bacterium]|jgi:hypothetical protein|nr:hypothetical protein [Halobacteriovoraceae bacterium]
MVSGSSKAESYFSDCLTIGRKACFSKHDPNSIKQSWYEFDYYFLNRQTKISNERLSCWNKKGIQCASRAKELFPDKLSQEKMDEIGNRYKKFYASGEKEKARADKQAHDSHLSVLTLGLSDVKYGCLYDQYIENPIQEFSDSIMTIVQGICEGDSARKIAMAEDIEGAYGLFEAMGITNIADGVGLDLSINADAGVGVTSNLTIALRGQAPNSCYQFFCKTSIKASATLGVGAAAKGRVYLGCKRGLFSLGGARLSLGASVKFLLGANVSYGLGIDPNAFLNRLQKFNEEDKAKFKDELLGYVAKVKNDSALSDSSKASFLLFAKFMGSGIVAQFSEKELEEIDYGIEENQTLKGLFKEIIERGEDNKTASLGSLIKNDLGSIVDYVEGPTLLNVMTAFHEGITGCDIAEMGVSAGIIAGHGPNVAGSYSALLGEVPMRELNYFIASYAGGSAMVGALACADSSNFKKNMNAVINRFKDMNNNFRGCYDDSVEQLVNLGIRTYKISTGEGLQHDVNKSSYRRDFSKTHPHHDVCRCHPEAAECK